MSTNNKTAGYYNTIGMGHGWSRCSEQLEYHAIPYPSIQVAERALAEDAEDILEDGQVLAASTVDASGKVARRYTLKKLAGKVLVLSV